MDKLLAKLRLNLSNADTKEISNAGLLYLSHTTAAAYNDSNTTVEK